jgi:hypothetical protein
MSGSGKVQWSEPKNARKWVSLPSNAEGSALKDAPVWEFHCPRCRQTPRIRKSLIAAAIAKTGGRELDVSYTD